MIISESGLLSKLGQDFRCCEGSSSYETSAAPSTTDEIMFLWEGLQYEWEVFKKNQNTWRQSARGGCSCTRSIAVEIRKYMKGGQSMVK